MLVDLLLLGSTILIVWLGWSTGLTRTFLAFISGFVASFAANKYPYQEGINAYIIFLITAVFFIIIGAFILRLINFFYLNILDRIGGVFLSVCVWIIVFINLVVPTISNETQFNENNSYVCNSIDQAMQSRISIFKKYTPLVKHSK